MPKIILNMIVRDEAAVIQRCLDSVKPIIDGYYIVDTGSKDDTVGIIQGELKGIPGEIIHSPWTDDFALHRNQALEGIPKDSYALVMDADDELQIFPYFSKNMLTDPAYAIAHSSTGACKNYRVTLFKPRNLKWKGVRHERISGMDDPQLAVVLSSLRVRVNNDGARNKTDKFQGDIDALLRVIGEGNFDEMDIFNLAQSYKDAGHGEKAIETYQKFIHHYSGPDLKDIRCFASIICASIEEHLTDKNTRIYLERAIAIDPTRIEPYVFLGQYFLRHGMIEQAVLVSEKAISIPKTFHYLNEVTSFWNEGRHLLYQQALKQRDCVKA